MLKNKIILEVKRNEKIYELSLSHDSPLGECFDILREMQGFIIDKINESQKKAEESKEEAKQD